MSQQIPLVQLFLKENYKELANRLQKIPEPSIQDKHNLAIVDFINQGNSPIPFLTETIQAIKAEAPGEWPKNPSYPLLLYHLSLTQFIISDYENSINNIKELWDNSEKIDQYVRLCSALLIVEQVIRYNSTGLEDSALSYLKENYPTEESVNNFLSSKNIEEAQIQQLWESIQFAQMRVDVAKAIRASQQETVSSTSTPNNDNNNTQNSTPSLTITTAPSPTAAATSILSASVQSQNIDNSNTNTNANTVTNSSKEKSILEEILSDAPLFSDAKSRPNLPIKNILPIASAAFSTGDNQKFSTILENAGPINFQHFAILNNRGIYEIIQKHYSTALLYFSKALDARPSKLILYPFHQIIYNIGLSLLAKQKPRKAFEFFSAVIPVLGRSPYLWLRLAECCVSYYKLRVAKLRQRYQVSTILARKLQSPTRTYYVLPQSDLKIFNAHRNDHSNPDKNDQLYQHLDLSYADMCGKNVLALCANNPKYQALQHNAELICAYASLELGDGKRAADMTKAITNDRDYDPKKQFLAKIYAAQGHCVAGEVEESDRILKVSFMENVKSKEKDLLTMYHSTFAKVRMLLNDADAVQKRFEKVQEQEPNRPEVVLTKVAIDLKMKTNTLALETLQSYEPTQDH